MRGWPADAVLLTPTLTRLPGRSAGSASQAGVTDDAVRFSALVRIWNVTGQPAISLPLHATADGVPVGVQLVGPARPRRPRARARRAARGQRRLGAALIDASRRGSASAFRVLLGGPRLELESDDRLVTDDPGVVTWLDHV